jgi:predicted protein tyrosine phosphatase
MSSTIRKITQEVNANSPKEEKDEEEEDEEDDWDDEVSEDALDSLSQITEHIYLSNYNTAHNTKLLLEHDIRNVVTLSASPFASPFTPLVPTQRIKHEELGGEQLLISAIDCMKYPIIDNHFVEVYDFIEECVSKNQKVLVHCVAGVSRSPTMVIAYLMKKNRWSFEQAYSHVEKQRPFIEPNPGFLEQLQAMEMDL